MQTIPIISQRGGAGKTTLAVHLATAAAGDHVTLLVDTDPQAARADGANGVEAAIPR